MFQQIHKSNQIDPNDIIKSGNPNDMIKSGRDGDARSSG
jgi:hypothetical protein